ncbi:MAG: alpha/beta hydrolase fold domain-containing protein [Acidobacteriaceae bacterium]|nr:alpha/beta hydrolase fold domain-containing protein [Acidobacteriaceae bacterium]
MNLRKLFATAAIASASLPLAAQSAPKPDAPIHRVFVFGDSYSDTGRGYVDGNGPTAVWYAAQQLGIELKTPNHSFTPNDSLNFAVSGAPTGRSPGHNVTKEAMLGFGMANQVDEFVDLAHSGKLRFNPDETLFFLAGGGNDRTVPTLETVQHLEEEIQQLYAAGARRFRVAALPEQIPGFRAVALRLNTSLRMIPKDIGHKLPGATVQSSDWGLYFDAVMRSPATYGITDTKNPCAGRAIFHEDTTPCASPETFFYYHRDHPSTATHKAAGLMLAQEWQGKPVAAIAPVRLPVWPAAVPLARGHSEADTPFLEAYLPASNPTHTAVLVLPGGGYAGLALDHEGAQIGRWLAARNVAAIVLHYRVAPYQYPAPMLDAERAMRLVRSHAAEWGFNADSVGIWGFSAGGHLASFMLTHFAESLAPPMPYTPDAIDSLSARPTFGILCYPLISMGDPALSHPGSLANLLGPHPDPALVKSLSNELQVKPDSPPAFLFTTTDDRVVPVLNSIRFYEAYQQHHLPIEMHIFEHGNHGLGLAGTTPGAQAWPQLLETWLQRNGWMSHTE